MITFKFMLCPLCKVAIKHPGLQVRCSQVEDCIDELTLYGGGVWLQSLLAPLEALKEDVSTKALMRLRYEGLDKHADIKSKYNGNAAGALGPSRVVPML